MSKGLTITISGDGYVVSEFDGDLAELQAAVGGYIEAAPSSDHVTIWVNEDGKGLELPPNRLAMDIWLRYDVYRCILVGRDWLAGNVVITGGAGPDGETLDLRDDVRRWALRVARDAGATIR
jgi:hypothetical protein